MTTVATYCAIKPMNVLSYAWRRASVVKGAFGGGRNII